MKHYHILGELGKGNFGKVLKGKNKKTKEIRAIKVIEIDNNADENYIKYIENEIKNMKICSNENENSVKYYEHFCYHNKIIIVMELCDCSLQKVLDEKEKGFTCQEIFNIMNQLNNTFKIMNENNIIHRDIKLDNILIKFIENSNLNFLVKLTDYGISKQLSNGSIGKTQLGTPLTMAPEVLEGLNEYNYKCDLWSIGIIIYQMCFKEYPYKGKTQVALYNQIKQLGKKLLKKTNNQNLDNLINSLLVIEPEKRINYTDYFNHPFFKMNLNKYIININQKEDYKEIIDSINENSENSIKIPERIMSKINAKSLEDLNDYFEKLIIKIIEIDKELEFDKIPERKQLLKKIIIEAYNYSNINLDKRTIDFIEYISKENIKYENLFNAINEIKLENLENKNIDIIYFWKEYLTEQYINKKLMINSNKLSKDIIRMLIKENYSLSEIYNIFDKFKKIISNESFSQFEIINSLVSIIIAFEIKEINEELTTILEKNYIEEKSELNTEVVLEFYLKVSENNNQSKKLEINELLQNLKNINPNLSDFIINEIECQLKTIEFFINTYKYKYSQKKDFQKWAKKGYPKLNFKSNSKESIAKVLAMISMAINMEKEFYLRNAQLISILMFIIKEKNYGLIEKISAGEGKSYIICTLAIYFALSKKKVDIVYNSNILANKYSDKFRGIYDYFNLTTSYLKDNESNDSNSYNCDILYGTLLEYVSDYSKVIIYNKNIRNNRKFEVLIIDDVDNLLHGDILSGVHIKWPIKGFQFLRPFYLIIYFLFELYDLFVLSWCKNNITNPNPENKKKIIRFIKEPNYRRKNIMNYINIYLGKMTKKKEIRKK